MRIDLHTHSDFSDGTSSPAELVRRARREGLGLLVLTDHDTVSGCEEALAEARAGGPRVCCGIEINTCEDEQVHVLGYGIDRDSPVLAERLEDFRGRRRRRIALIVERLQALKLAISFEEIASGAKQTLGRPHVADALRAKGLVHTRQEAFRKYLMKGAPAYVPPMGPSVRDAIETISAAGGWASLAHPGLLKKEHDLSAWAALGLKGLEVYYPAHAGGMRERLLATADRLGLVPTGGSDYHGPGTGREHVGCAGMPPELVERLVGLLGERP